MANHVANIISFKGDDAQIKKLLSEVQNDEFGPGSICFQKLIPMPPELNIESGSRTDKGIKAYADCVLGAISEEASADAENQYLRAHPEVDRQTFMLGKQACRNIANYNAPTWYEWHIKNWGTKWDAYGYDEGGDYSQTGDLRFLTAWCAPHPILTKLSALYPNVEITHRWADEDIGHNCGSAVYRAGSQTELVVMTDETQATEFANRLWSTFNSGQEMEQQM